MRLPNFYAIIFNLFYILLYLVYWIIICIFVEHKNTYTMSKTITISIETINNAIKNANTCIAFEDNESDKKYYRGVKDTFVKLLELNEKGLLK